MKIIAAIVLLSIAALYGGFLIAGRDVKQLEEKIANIIEKPLEKYTFENLRKTKFPESLITVGRLI